ncbi:MAG TPA: tetratricopeptide repeat protein [Acidimicrobiia bacterium]|nr:tetratricopeptide repeat protein [Acidimicrobiia bacterium]
MGSGAAPAAARKRGGYPVAVVGPVELSAFAPRIGVEWLAQDPTTTWRTADGTIGFFDVSGFTRLSERLARLGKLGSEAISEIVDGIYEGLIDPVLAYGGDVIQFSGDAILVLFTGDDHARRGALAAAAMQRFITRSGRVETELGAVRLRMSVGMHSGELHFVLLGAEHRHVLAFGPGASAMCAMEKVADAGEVLVSDAMAAALDPRWLGGARDGGRLLRRVPVPDLTAADATHGVAAPDGPAADFVAPSLRVVLGSGSSHGEHRQLVLGFVGVRGVDHVFGSSGADEASARLRTLAYGVERVAADLELTWVSADALPGGCDFFLVAGAPAMREDDEDRMLIAMRRILAIDSGLRTAAGVNRGRIFVGDVGHPRRRVYGVTGDAANLAARVMAHAPDGLLLATPPVLERTRLRFDAEPLLPFRAKGKAAPVETMSVGDARGRRDAPDRQELVGRDDETDTLLRAVVASDGVTVEVVGAAGLGKTRIVEEVRRRAPGSDEWLWLRGEPYAAADAYAPFRTALRASLGLAAGADPATVGAALLARARAVAPEIVPWLPLLALVVDGVVEATDEVQRLAPEFVRDRLHETVTTYVAAALPARVVVAEDTHWFDEASRALLDHLADVDQPCRFAVVTTRRPEGASIAERAPFIRIDLTPLDRAAATRIAISAAEDAGMSDHDLGVLVERAGGNPLFLRELVLARRAGSGMPDSLERLLASRVDTVDLGSRTVLRDASVVGPEVDLALLAEACGDDRVVEPDTWRALSEFVTIDRGAIRFRHELVRVAAYEGLSYRRRRELHGRVGDALAARAQTPPGALALHFAEAQRWPEAWRWSVAAARDAQSKVALVEAIEHFERALHAARRLDLADADVAVVGESLGDAALRVGRLEDAVAAYRVTGARTDLPAATRGRLMRKVGEVREREGRYRESIRWLRRAMRILDGCSEPEAETESVRAQLAYSVTRHYQGHFREALEAARPVVSRATSIGDARAVAQAYLQLEMNAGRLGLPERADHEARGLELWEQLGDDLGLGNLLLNVAVTALNAGNTARALELNARARAAYERAGDVIGAGIAVNNRAEILTDQGHWDEARECLLVARRIMRAAGYRFGVALTTSGLSRLELRAHRTEEAQSLLAEALDEFRALGSDDMVLDTRVREVEVLLYTGRAEQALSCARQVIRDLDTFGPYPVVPITARRFAAYALLALGDVASARIALEDARERADREHARYESALTRLALAECAHREGAPDDEPPTVAAQILEGLGVVEVPPIPT